MKKQKQKKSCYAIHYLDNGENIIVKAWSECQKKTKGRGNMFKGFASETEAKEWLNSISPKQEAAHREQVKRNKKAKNAEAAKVLFELRLERQVADDLQKRSAALKMNPETLVENLILEYLYDMDH